MYSTARRRGEVHCLLLLSSLQFITRPTPCPPAYDGGRGVGHHLHHKEERRSTLGTPLCASSPPCDGVHNALLLILYTTSRLRGVGCVLHCKEPLLLVMEYAAYSCWTRSCWRFLCHLICNIEVVGEILMAILDVFYLFFYLPLEVLVMMLLSFGHHPRQNNIPLFKRSAALWCGKIGVGGGHGDSR